MYVKPFLYFLYIQYHKEIINTEKSLDHLYSIFQNHSNDTIKTFPKDHLWRLFIDQNKDPDNLFYFNIREENYIGSLFNALAFAIDYLSIRPLRADDVVLLHDFAIDHVRDSDQYQIAKGLCIGNVQFGLSSESFSPEGIQEFKTKTEFVKGVPGILVAQTKLFKNKHSTGYKAISSGNSISRYGQANALCNSLEEEMLSALNDDEKVCAIVRFAQNLEQSHLFSDGNLRTSAMVILNALLLKESMVPVIWEDPNCLDGYSLDQCCELVREGQKRFLSYCNK